MKVYCRVYIHFKSVFAENVPCRFCLDKQTSGNCLFFFFFWLGTNEAGNVFLTQVGMWNRMSIGRWVSAGLMACSRFGVIVGICIYLTCPIHKTIPHVCYQDSNVVFWGGANFPMDLQLLFSVLLSLFWLV